MIFDYLIIGYYKSSNAGDVWLEHKTRRILKNINQNATIISHDCKKKSRTFLHIVTANTIIFGGGSIFQDKTSIKSVLYYCLLIWWAKILQKPILLLGQGYGPVKRKWLNYFIKISIKNCAVSARDAASYSIFKKISPQTIHATDLIYLKAKQAPISQSKITKIWLSYHPSLRTLSFTLKTAIDATKLPLEIIVSDTKKDIPTYVFKHTPAIKLQSLINKSTENSVLISGRYHACVWASLRNIPFIGISDDPKIKALAKDLQQSYISVHALQNAPELLDKTLLSVLSKFDVAQKELFDNTAKLIKKATEHYIILPTQEVQLKNIPLWTESINTLIDSSRHSKNGFEVITTLNATIWTKRHRNIWIRNAINTSKWITADGSGITFAAKILQQKIIPKCRGVDIAKKILKTNGIRVALLGSKPVIIDKIKSPNIVWKHHGYFDEADLEKITNEIKTIKPDFILIALGAPKQEKILLHFKTKLSTGVGIGVGGAFDVISGQKKIAPNWITSNHLEWLYRSIQNPKKILLWPTLIHFTYEVFTEKVFKK